MTRSANASGNATVGWLRLDPSGSLPHARYGHSCVAFEDKMIVFGGHSKRNLNDMWVYDGSSSSWRRASGADDHAPPNRTGHTCSVIGRKMYVFGGEGGQVAYNDLWEFDLVDGHWSPVSLSSDTRPSPRYAHCATTFGNKLLIFGGHNVFSKRIYDDIWMFDTVTRGWLKLETAGAKPMKRYGATITVVGNHIVLFGGCGQGMRFNDVWSLNPGTLRWTAYDPASKPPPRNYHAATSSPDQKLVIFGGFGGHGTTAAPLNDTWDFDLIAGRWSKPKGKKDEPVPSARYGHSICALTSQEHVLFGGAADGMHPHNDLWLLALAPGRESTKEGLASSQQSQTSSTNGLQTIYERAEARPYERTKSPVRTGEYSTGREAVNTRAPSIHSAGPEQVKKEQDEVADDEHLGRMSPSMILLNDDGSPKLQRKLQDKFGQAVVKIEYETVDQIRRNKAGVEDCNQRVGLVEESLQKEISERKAVAEELSRSIQGEASVLNTRIMKAESAAKKGLAELEDEVTTVEANLRENINEVGRVVDDFANQVREDIETVHSELGTVAAGLREEVKELYVDVRKEIGTYDLNGIRSSVELVERDMSTKISSLNERLSEVEATRSVDIGERSAKLREMEVASTQMMSEVEMMRGSINDILKRQKREVELEMQKLEQNILHEQERRISLISDEVEKRVNRMQTENEHRMSALLSTWEEKFEQRLNRLAEAKGSPFGWKGETTSKKSDVEPTPAVRAHPEPAIVPSTRLDYMNVYITGLETKGISRGNKWIATIKIGGQFRGSREIDYSPSGGADVVSSFHVPEIPAFLDVSVLESSTDGSFSLIGSVGVPITEKFPSGHYDWYSLGGADGDARVCIGLHSVARDDRAHDKYIQDREDDVNTAPTVEPVDPMSPSHQGHMDDGFAESPQVLTVDDNSSPPPPSSTVPKDNPWIEVIHPDTKRPYYFNMQTNVTSLERPAEYRPTYGN